jgi:hypothetical protein
MKTITKTFNIYKFSELSEDAKQNVLTKNIDINTSFQWWESTYEDATNIGLKLKGFDLDRNRHATGEFIESAENCAHKIESEHGDTCETYKTAKAYLSERDELINNWEKDENGDILDTWELDEQLDELDKQFLKDILEDYSIMLQKEYEYLYSDKAIIETIESNDYNFTEEGEIYF